ncbi:MAG TPA: hypothetical protein PLR44_00385 [Thermomicrobiales bacterium]|nr:hypothetical protein [Chloroflexota bacterium]HQZ88496.1 hypothetical protein [Thermomicrobiales bacterium]HRA30374.1 hypothetical protein [Thermomicrobiales bacterium]
MKCKEPRSGRQLALPAASPRLIASTVEPFIDGVVRIGLFFAPDGRYFLEYECSGWWWYLEREGISVDQAARAFDAFDHRAVSKTEAFP